MLEMPVLRFVKEELTAPSKTQSSFRIGRGRLDCVVANGVGKLV